MERKVTMSFFILDIMGPVRLNRFDYTDGEDSGQSWRRWLRSFKYMLQAIDITEDDVKYNMLMHYMGEKAQEVYEGLPDPPEAQTRGPLLSVDRYTSHRTEYEKAVEKLKLQSKTRRTSVTCCD